MKPAYVMLLIVVAVLAWAHVSCRRGPISSITIRGGLVMVLGCVIAFLGFWGAMLAARRPDCGARVKAVGRRTSRKFKTQRSGKYRQACRHLRLHSPGSHCHVRLQWR